MTISKFTPILSVFFLSACGLGSIEAALSYDEKEEWTNETYDEAKSLGDLTAQEFTDLAGSVTYDGTIRIYAINSSDTAEIFGDATLVLDFDTNDLTSSGVSGLVGSDENGTFGSYSGTVDIELDGAIDRTFTLLTSGNISGNGDTIVFVDMANDLRIRGSNAQILRTGGYGVQDASINGEDAYFYGPSFVLERQ